MDKKLSIALLLTAIIVAVTPILFPTARRAAPPTVSSPTGEAAPPGANRREPVPGLTAPSVVAPLAESSGIEVASLLPPMAATRVSEVTTVTTSTSTYQFASDGAVPLSIAIPEYKSLTSSGGVVTLKSSGAQPLLQYSLVLQGDTVPLDKTPFRLFSSTSPAGNRVLTYRATVSGVGVVISYDMVPDKYVVHISGRVNGSTGPVYLLVNLPSSLPATEADTVGDLRSLSYSFKPTRSHARGIQFGKLNPGERTLEAGPLAWAAVRNKYFVVGLLNLEGSSFEEVNFVGGTRTSKIATTASATAVKAIKDGAFAFDMYAGPQQSTQLLAMGRDFDNVNPYGWSFLQPVVNPIAALCLKALLWVHARLHLSYGWVLVLFGVFIRIALWPLNQSAMRSSMKMQELQPKLAEVQKKYKDKPERQREEMMRVYKEAGASPFTALSGCLPMLIPMPVLFALFFVFQNTIEFRGVPFLWLTDISIKDPAYILPVLMGVSMYVLSWIGLRNAPPNPQAKMMSYMFPVMMTFVLANMASGLNLYYTAQNLAALPQQWLLARERMKARKPG